MADVLLLLTALLASFGFDTQSLSAQGGQRRTPHFQQRSGQPLLNGLFSSIAILIGLLAIYKQGRQIEKSINEQRAANYLTAKMAYLEYLRSEIVRLEEDIQRLKSSNKYDKNLLDNMSNKKSDFLAKSKLLSEEIENYYEKVS